MQRWCSGPDSVSEFGSFSRAAGVSALLRLPRWQPLWPQRLREPQSLADPFNPTAAQPRPHDAAAAPTARPAQQGFGAASTSAAKLVSVSAVT
eukprot:6819277-Pyramimonas_sp.AAC.1